MKKALSEIYNPIIEYCKDGGYLRELKKSLNVSETKRFNDKNISNVGLDVLDAVHCLYDKKRTEYFLNCINNAVNKGDIVIEAGIGTGVLSYMAVSKGAKVYGVELNKKVLLLANKIRQSLHKNKIIKNNLTVFLQEDAIKYAPPQRADVLISENIYTGMFYEKQVQIMNNLIRYLRKGGVTIPSALITGVFLVNIKTSKNILNKDLIVVNEYKKDMSLSYLSEGIVYDNLNFSKKNKLIIDKKIKLKVVKTGDANGVLIWSKVVLPDGNIIDRKDTIFLNNDIVIPIRRVEKVKKGDIIRMHIRYKYGSMPKNSLFKII